MDSVAEKRQGGVMATSATFQKTNIRDFPVAEKTGEFSELDNFLIKIGAKEMTTSKTSTTPMEWNKSVLGLVATLVVILSVLVGFVWNYAVLSTKFDSLQKENERQAAYEQKEREKLEIRVKGLEDGERKRQSDADRLSGYKIGKAEEEGKK